MVRLVVQRWEIPITAAVFLKAPPELMAFTLSDRANDMRSNVVRRHDTTIEHFRPDDEHVERRLQVSRNPAAN